MFWFERTVRSNIKILALGAVQLCELDTNLLKVGRSYLLVQHLGRSVNTNRIIPSISPECNLDQDLAGERVGHDNRGSFGQPGCFDATPVGVK